ncbi:ATP-dependent Clp protease ATP-binding subunit CLPT2, chloroplastic-like isoform X2 [Bidens hawaiensis]|uniref:ATP-dependent Clp protease ATP-binding subunit CLPT2, chloroplastic-like isoform X2 n=1 Tax=Bidens hawaiensis TaxID=980011 RepID=UPI004048F16D
MASHTLFSSSITCTHHQSIYKPDPFSSITHIPTHSLHSKWLGITKLSIKHSHIRPKTRPVSATVSFSLPTANPERVDSADKVPKWSLKGIKSFAMGELEARKLKFANTGTEGILMGLLVEGTNRASKLLRANGFTLTKVREEVIKLIGKPDFFYYSPEHPPLTESAQKALDWAVDEKLKSGNFGEITTSHLLLGVWSQKEGAGYKIMATLGFDDEKAQQLHSLVSKPGFAED